MNTNTLLCKEEVFQVVGAAMEVLNTLGHGLHEKPYENALAIEFECRGIPFTQQPRYDIGYKDQHVGTYIPDLLAFDSVIVDTKTIDRITDIERGQILNYLRISGCRVGIILNFKNPRLEWERLVV